MKNKLLLFLAILFCGTVTAQLKSPEEFLGYKIGTRYTPHWLLVNYFQHVAQQTPQLVKLEQYGVTNERRPLYLTYIATDKNLLQLDEIRKNNLRLAGVLKDKDPDTNMPAIVWLSYNVHGNETSSSEAAMLTLYELVNPSSPAAVKEWLQQAVVIMDPCLNPDGRDRYVNWYNSIVGDSYNARLDTREHREPWPGGRTNHYNFDLNRDWAWQTQIESQQRMKVYNSWLPQIHVDFHEQGINMPYYFAPGAQPFHESITSWQRSFQEVIGKNNAAYFDKNNWLYFTKEIFDLFYPSYGDTYPIYNGAIGMTYEQAGGGAAGLGATTDEGDTLTLAARAIHHHTTGLSTIETAVKHKKQLLMEFQQFFEDAAIAKNTIYKSYVIKYSASKKASFDAMRLLLDKNGIEYGTGSGSGKGFAYFTQKEASFTINKEDLVIPVAQPKGVLVNVLFEPASKLVDSVTYDITAWALPYVYGLESYASKNAVKFNAGYQSEAIVNNAADNYAYVIKWEGLSAAKATAALLKEGYWLRYASKPFEANGETFPAGSIILLKKGNEQWGAKIYSKLNEITNKFQLRVYPVQSGLVDKGADFGSGSVAAFKAPKIVLLTGETVNSNAAGEVWHFMERELNYPLSLVNAADIGRLDWNNTDVLILPSGNYSFLTNKAQIEQFTRWISSGGRVIALENAVMQLSLQEWSALKMKKTDVKKDSAVKDPYANLKPYEGRSRRGMSDYTPGAIYRVDVDSTHPLMYGYKEYYTLRQDDILFDYLQDGGWNAGYLKKDNYVAGFVGEKLRDRLTDGVLFAVQPMGRGSITYLADNILFRNFWHSGELMFANALFLVGVN